MTMMAMMTEIIRCDVAGHGSQCFFWKVEFRNSNNLLLLLLLSAISMAPLPSSRTPIFTRVGAGISQQAFAYLLTTLRYSWTQWTVVIVRIRAVHFHTHSASGNRDAHPR
ncbi:hypothetical protein TYRP_015441 [Tyrophagus putrescentiae]|nr:hypothetical protein TYRP_015441 [Tyrophagus putrescentiae]